MQTYQREGLELFSSTPLALLQISSLKQLANVSTLSTLTFHKYDP